MFYKSKDHIEMYLKRNIFPYRSSRLTVHSLKFYFEHFFEVKNVVYI